MFVNSMGSHGADLIDKFLRSIFTAFSVALMERRWRETSVVEGSECLGQCLEKDSQTVSLES